MGKMLSIKETFDLENKKIDKNTKQIKRMNKLIESFDNKNEVIKENKNDKVNEKELQKEVDRLKTLNEYGNDSVNQGGMFYGGGYGQTVNTFFDKNQSYVKKYADNGSAELTESEALEISIKRTLKSGTPISNMGFYDEVNWNINQLGFNSKQPNDIKTAVYQLILSGTINKDNVS